MNIPGWVLEGGGWVAETLWRWAKPKLKRALEPGDTEPSHPLSHQDVDGIERQIDAATSFKVQKGKRGT